MIFSPNDTFMTAAWTAFSGLFAEAGPENELSYVRDECGFESKAVRDGLTELEKRAKKLLTKLEPVSRKKIGAASGMFENLSFYLETSDCYDDEEAYVRYVISGMNEMMDAFEKVVN